MTSRPGCQESEEEVTWRSQLSPPLSHENDLHKLKSEALPAPQTLSKPFRDSGGDLSQTQMLGVPRVGRGRGHPGHPPLPRSRGPCATRRGRCSGRLPGRCGKGWAAAPSPRGDSSRPLPLPPPSPGLRRRRRRCSAQEIAARAPARQSRSRAGVGALGECARLRAPAQQPEQRPPPARRGCPDSGPRGWAPGGNRSGGAAPPLRPPSPVSEPQLLRPRAPGDILTAARARCLLPRY